MEVSNKVLIVEDEVLIAFHIAELLKSISINTIELAHSFEEAVEKVNNFQPQLVILDINLNSVKDGIDFAEFLNKKAPIDFIFLTANTDLKKMSEAITKKPFAVLTKPIKKIDLTSNVSLFFNSQKDKFKKNNFQSKRKNNLPYGR